MVKRHKQKGCKIFYTRRPELDTAEDKLVWLGSSKAWTLSFQRIEPDRKYNWLDVTGEDWDELIPIASKDTKAGKRGEKKQAIFRNSYFFVNLHSLLIPFSSAVTISSIFCGAGKSDILTSRIARPQCIQHVRRRAFGGQ